MPPVEWIDIGYQGVGWPQLELLFSLAFDYRYGLFVSSPLLLLAAVSPLVNRQARRLLPNLELSSMLAFFVAFWAIFSGVNYTRLQFNTGMRYMAPMLPFLFVPAAIVLMRLPRLAIYLISILSFAQSWCLAMYRDVERGFGLLEPILHVFSGGFQLPALTTLSRTGNQYGEYFANGASPLPLFVFAAVVICAIWASKPRLKSLPASPPSSNEYLPPYTLKG